MSINSMFCSRAELRASTFRSRAEPRASTPSLLWLGERAPPAQLVNYLRERGYRLRFQGTRSALDEPESAQADSQDAGRSHALAPQRIAILERMLPRSLARPSLTGRRIALIEPDPGRADSLAQALRAKGAEVVALSAAPESFLRAEPLDPDVLLISSEHFYGASWQLVEQVWKHPRLRWATVLLALPEALGFGELMVPDIRTVCAGIQALNTESDRLIARAHAGESFAVPLHCLGPVRTLRLLVGAASPLRAVFCTGASKLEVDAAKQLIIGARGVLRHEAGEPEHVFGPAALAACLSLQSGEVTVFPIDRPEVANVVAPLDSALHTTEHALLLDTDDRPTLPVLETATRRIHPKGSEQRSSPDLLRPSGQAAEVNEVPKVATLTPSVERPVCESVARPAAHSVPFRAYSPRTTALHALAAASLLLGFGMWLSLEHELRTDSSTTGPSALSAQAEPAKSFMVAHAVSAASTSDAETQVVLSPSDAVEQHDSGESALLAGEDGASAALATTTDGSPLSVSVRAAELARRGNSLSARGLYAQAVSKYRAALKLSPGCPQALAGMARLSLKWENAADSITYAKLLVRARPGQAVYHLLLGDAYQLADMLAEARATWRVAARLGSKRARSRLTSRGT